VFVEQAISVELAQLMLKLQRSAPNSGLLGIGLDIETIRPVSLETARFFLSEQEQAGLEDPKTLLRLWTVKEAIFKADPENDEKILGDYVLENPSEWSGTAYMRGRKGLRFHYSSIEVRGGFLSIAVSAKGDGNA
jgi:hypothetical protein